MGDESKTKALLDGCIWELFLHRDFGRTPPGCTCLVALVAIAAAVALPQWAHYRRARSAHTARETLRWIAKAQEAFREVEGTGKHASGFGALDPHVEAEHRVVLAALARGEFHDGYGFFLVAAGNDGRFAVLALPEGSVTTTTPCFLVTGDGVLHVQELGKTPFRSLEGVPDPAGDAGWTKMEDDE
jgi:type II secretory pathway pseudopilin PulG